MSDDQKAIPLCACLEVRYDPEQLPDGAKRDRWTCTACGAPFCRALLPDCREMERRLSAAERRIIQLEEVCWGGLRRSPGSERPPVMTLTREEHDACLEEDPDA